MLHRWAKQGGQKENAMVKEGGFLLATWKNGKESHLATWLEKFTRFSLCCSFFALSPFFWFCIASFKEDEQKECRGWWNWWRWYLLSVITEWKEKCVKLWGNLHMVAVVSSCSNSFSMFYFWVTMSHALLFYVILCNWLIWNTCLFCAYNAYWLNEGW